MTRLERVYKAADRRLKAAFLRFDPQTFTADKADAIRSTARAVVAVLDAEAGRWSYRDVAQAYSSQLDKISKVLARQERPRPIQTAPPRDRRTAVQQAALVNLLRANRSIVRSVDQIADQMLYAVAVARSIPARAEEFEYSEIAEEVRAWARETVRNQLARRDLLARISHRLAWLVDENGFIEINGRHYQLYKYAETVASVAMREAQVEATLEAMAQYGEDLAEFVGGGGCELCAPLVGRVFSISGADPEFPALTADETPPLHPHCRHDLYPTSRAEMRVRAKEV